MPREPEKVIRDVLGQSPKTRNELLRECVGQGITKQTYYRHLKRMIKLGEVKEAKYVLIEAIEEADPVEVEDCVGAILAKKGEEVTISRIQALQSLAARKRVAHLPRVIDFFEKCLNDRQMYCSTDILRELAYVLSTILRFEKQKRSPGSLRIIEQMLNATFPRMKSIVDSMVEYPDGYIIDFLGETGKEEAVELLFRKIKGHPEEAAQKLHELAYALGKHDLYRQYLKIINERFDQLIQSDDETTRKVGKDLRQQIMSSPDILRN